MAEDDNNTGAEPTPGPVRKKAAKKKATRKKATKKAAARAAAHSAPTPAEPPRPPQPERAYQSTDAAMHEHGGADEESSISGWLVMWGPLIIVGFLILVFMGDERGSGSTAAAPPQPASAPDATQAPAEAPAAVRALDVSPEQAAADLAEAFKAAGIPLPAPATERSEDSARSAPSEPDLPADLQGNPWAPAAGQPPVGALPPPPPGYGSPYGHYPYGGGYPPHYPYGAPPPGYYGYGGWGPPPGYGPGYGAMPHAAPGYMGQGYPGMMGPGADQGQPMMQPAMPGQEAPASDQQREDAAPPPPSN